MTYNVSSGTLNLYTTTTVSVMSCQQGVIATLVFFVDFCYRIQQARLSPAMFYPDTRRPATSYMYNLMGHGLI